MGLLCTVLLLTAMIRRQFHRVHPNPEEHVADPESPAWLSRLRGPSPEAIRQAAKADPRLRFLRGLYLLANTLYIISFALVLGLCAYITRPAA